MADVRISKWKFFCYLLAAFILGCLAAGLRVSNQRDLPLQSDAVLAQIQATMLKSSIDKYYQLYGRWPSKSTSPENQVLLSDDQSDVMKILSGQDRQFNPQGVAFLVSPSGAQLSSYRDPWGNPYKICFPANTLHPDNIQRSTIEVGGATVWSDGPGKIESGKPVPSSYRHDQ